MKRLRLCDGEPVIKGQRDELLLYPLNKTINTLRFTTELELESIFQH